MEEIRENQGAQRTENREAAGDGAGGQMVPDQAVVYMSWKFRFHWDTNMCATYINKIITCRHASNNMSGKKVSYSNFVGGGGRRGPLTRYIETGFV